MPTDMFGNFLTPEEEERLRQQQLRMGLLPGFLSGPAVDTFSDIPRSLPAYGPAAGLGPSGYMGAPQGMPTYNQSPSLAAPSILVDAGASTPTSLFSLPAPYQRYEAPEQKVRYMASRTPMTPTPIDPTYGLAATDPNLQGVTPSSMASTAATPIPAYINPTPIPTPAPRDMSGIQRARDLAGQRQVASASAATQRAQDSARRQQVASQQVADSRTNWLGNVGIYDDLLNKKAVYDKGLGHPTIVKELVKSLAADRQAAQAAARAQAASKAQADRARAQARAVIANAAGRDTGGPSSRELAAAREVLSQVDTFGGGRITGDRNGGAAGALGGYRGDPVGREAAIESRGGGRGGGGRGGPGGRGR